MLFVPFSVFVSVDSYLVNCFDFTLRSLSNIKLMTFIIYFAYSHIAGKYHSTSPLFFFFSFSYSTGSVYTRTL